MDIPNEDNDLRVHIKEEEKANEDLYREFISDDCVCSLEESRHWHCRLCASFFKTSFRCKRHFIQSHLNGSVAFESCICLPCKINHEDGKFLYRAHFHCPKCHRYLMNKLPFIRHLSKHCINGSITSTKTKCNAKEREELSSLNSIYKVRCAPSTTRDNNIGVKTTPTEATAERETETGVKRLILGKVTKEISKNFFRFVGAFQGDIMSVMNFLFLRNIPAEGAGTFETKMDLIVNVKEAHGQIIYDMLDDFIAKRKLWSRGDAIEVLISECGICWNIDSSITFSSTKIDTMKKLNEDREANQLCDVAISVTSKIPDDVKVYHAHKCVLAVESSHFRRILHKDTDSIQISSDAESIFFGLVLDFIYSGEIKLEASNCWSIFSLAVQFEIKKLVDLCEDFLKLSRNQQGDNVMNIVVIKTDDNVSDLENNQELTKETEQVDATDESEESISSSFTPAPATRKKRGVVVHTCDDCGKRFTRYSHLIRHMPSHREKKRHCCTACGKLFPKASSLQRHEQSHSKERPFQCSTCGKTFKTKDGLRSHEWTHDGYRPFFCDVCGKQFKYQSSLLLHQKTHVVGDFVCQYCDKVFNNEVRFQNHMSVHTNPPTCKICGKQFKYRAQMLRHEAIHTGSRSSLSCEDCGKQFFDVYSLKLHQKRHTGEGLHECPKCDKKFLSKYHLVRHDRVHTGEKPYQCSHCNKSFTRADNLRNHELTVCSALFPTVKKDQSNTETQITLEEEILQDSDDDVDGDAVAE